MMQIPTTLCEAFGLPSDCACVNVDMGKFQIAFSELPGVVLGSDPRVIRNVAGTKLAVLCNS